jgi:heterotetrameric sarcosine oxidase gamma subunit
VADDLLRRRSALAALYREGSHGAAPGVSLAEQRLPGMIQVTTWGDETALGGIALPGANRASVTGDVTALWVGPRRFLLVGPGLLQRLEGSGAALVDQGHARTVIRTSGPRTRDLLAKGTGIDLARFAENDVALTLLGHVPAALHVVEAEAIDLYVARSYALTLWEWLLDAAEEYGYRVEPRNDRREPLVRDH